MNELQIFRKIIFFLRYSPKSHLELWYFFYRIIIYLTESEFHMSILSDYKSEAPDGGILNL